MTPIDINDIREYECVLCDIQSLPGVRDYHEIDVYGELKHVCAVCHKRFILIDTETQNERSR